MTRLEEHRTTLRSAKNLGPLLALESLDEDELAIINRSFLDRCRQLAASDIVSVYRAYVITLHEWGVMCPHPQLQRVYDGWFRSEAPRTFDEHRWYDCSLCGSAVINR